MAEYIEREAALESVREKLLITEALPPGIPKDASTFTLASMQHSLESIPAADVVPVVRCEECRHWHRCLSDDGSVEYFNFSYCEKGHNGFPTFFCADGVRKDGDGDV